MSETYVKDYTSVYTIRGQQYEVTAPARFDSKTNEVVYDPQLDDAAAEMANAMYREEFDIVSPEQIKTFRKSNGLSQRDVAKLLGWSKTTVSLYEAGAIPNEANNKMLQMVMTDRNFYWELFNRSGIDPNKKPLEMVSVLKLAHWFMVQSYFEVKKDDSGFVEPLGLLKVQKLLYQLKGVALAKFDMPLYEEDSLAWEYGPVVDSVYQEYKKQRDLTKDEFITEDVFNDYSELMANTDIAMLLDEVWNKYGSKRASELVTITHSPGSPWAQTDLNAIISNDITQKYFKQLL